MKNEQFPASGEGQSESKIDPIDHRVGQNIKKRRRELGYIQNDVAKVLGVSYQQMQKYEKGTNRISSSKLFYLSIFLEIPVADLFRPLEEEENALPTPEQLKSASEAPVIQELVTNFYKIGDGRIRDYLLDLIILLSRSNI